MTQKKISNKRIKKVFGADFLQYHNNPEAYIKSRLHINNNPKKVFDVEAEVKPVIASKHAKKDVIQTLKTKKERVFEENGGNNAISLPDSSCDEFEHELNGQLKANIKLSENMNNLIQDYFFQNYKKHNVLEKFSDCKTNAYLSDNELLFNGIIYKKLPIQHPFSYKIMNNSDLFISIYIEINNIYICKNKIIRGNDWVIFTVINPKSFYVRADLINHLTINQLNDDSPTT